MILMLLLKLGVDQNVIHKDHDKLIQIGLEYPMHETHECCWRIHQSEGHYYELKVPIPRFECCVRDIYLPNPQLMIASAKVHLGVDSCSSQLIEQVINPRQWIPILDYNTVQLSLVNEQSRVLSFFFANKTRAPHGEVLCLMNHCPTTPVSGP